MANIYLHVLDSYWNNNKELGELVRYADDAVIRGWIKYYRIGTMRSICYNLDGTIRYRLRMCIWKYWKTPQNRAKNLIKLGVPKWCGLSSKIDPLFRLNLTHPNIFRVWVSFFIISDFYTVI